MMNHATRWTLKCVWALDGSAFTFSPAVILLLFAHFPCTTVKTIQYRSGGVIYACIDWDRENREGNTMIVMTVVGRTPLTVHGTPFASRDSSTVSREE